MLHQLVASALESPHDVGVHEVAALSARLAYVFMCLALCWGIFTSTGWIHRWTGRPATRSSHIVLVTMAVAFGSLHALAFLLMADSPVEFVALVVPFLSGGLPVAFGIVTLEMMVTIALSTAVARALRYRRWLWLHRLGYPTIALGVLHSLLGAMIDRHLATLWLAGLTVLVPTAMLATLRFVPTRLLTSIGIVKADVTKPELRVTVNNQRCHRYGICEAEAPGNFEITEDGRLRYERRPAPGQRVRVRMAARACPMQAITLEERGQ